MLLKLVSQNINAMTFIHNRLSRAIVIVARERLGGEEPERIES